MKDFLQTPMMVASIFTSISEIIIMQTCHMFVITLFFILVYGILNFLFEFFDIKF